MGFEPDAAERTLPFVNGSNHLALARRRGLGENRLNQLDLVGLSLDTARFHFHPTSGESIPDSFDPDLENS
jgi:hypothetical protein